MTSSDLTDDSSPQSSFKLFQIKFDENKAKSLPLTAMKPTASNGNLFLHNRFEPHKINIESNGYPTYNRTTH